MSDYRHRLERAEQRAEYAAAPRDQVLAREIEIIVKPYPAKELPDVGLTAGAAEGYAVAVDAVPAPRVRAGDDDARRREGLKVSLAGAEQKLGQLDAQLSQDGKAIQLGMPSFGQIAGRAT
ncbi:hypothetical protein ACFWAR_19515 [Streptomyces sp. NPDC059917]|uniref:hypothetical protein n=1 Tax=Streptomyces sp. NPDC059917 TaxID=3347002 RepID=UPI0036469F15